MKQRFKLKGVDKFFNKLEETLKKKEIAVTTKGCMRVAIFIRNESEKTYPVVPVDTGHLRASFFTFIKGSDNSIQTVPAAATAIKPVPAAVTQQTNANLTLLKTTVTALPTPGMIFGFAANYAMAVHEKKGAEWNRPNSGPKYFLTHLVRNKKKLLTILAESAKE